MNIFLQNFSNFFPKTHQIALFSRFFLGELAPEPPANAPCKYTLFSKNILTPPTKLKS